VSDKKLSSSGFEGSPIEIRKDPGSRERSVRFEHEKRVKFFTRKTPTFHALGWEGRLVLFHLYCEVNLLGRLEVPAKDDLHAIAVALSLPEELLAIGLPRLLEHDRVRWEPAGETFPKRNATIQDVSNCVGGTLSIVDFVEEQLALRSAALRNKEKRERRSLSKAISKRNAAIQGVTKLSVIRKVTSEEARAQGLINRGVAAEILGVSIPTLRRRYEAQALPTFQSELGEYLFRPDSVQALAVKLREASSAKAPAARAEPLEDPIWRERAARLAEAMGAKTYTRIEVDALAKKIGLKDHLVAHVLAAAEGLELVKMNGRWSANRGEK